MKIDRSIVEHAGRDAAAAAIIRSVVGLGHELGLAVIAEGVETEQHERLLRRLGVSLLRGYRFGRPQPAHQVLRPPRCRTVPAAPPIPAPLPPSEGPRLVALRSLAILDTAPEAVFDTITQIAAQMFSVPIALVSLVDSSRQWFKSRVGLDATETPRDVSFCSHDILQRGVFVVENCASCPHVAAEPSDVVHRSRPQAGMLERRSGAHRCGPPAIRERPGSRSFPREPQSPPLRASNVRRACAAPTGRSSARY